MKRALLSIILLGTVVFLPYTKAQERTIKADNQKETNAKSEDSKNKPNAADISNSTISILYKKEQEKRSSKPSTK